MVGIPRCVAAGTLALLSPSPASRIRHAIVSSTPRTPHGTPHRRQETRGREPFRFAYTASAPAGFTNSSTRTTQTGNLAVVLAPGHFAHSRRPQERHGPPRGARRREPELLCPRLRASSRCTRRSTRIPTLVCADRVQRRCLNHETPSVDVARSRDPPQIAHPHRDAPTSSRYNELHARRRIALPPRSARPPTRSSSP
ncbi:hypothetical protein DFH09DRAFT_1170485, partial [Mycena vulgaris]